MMKILDDGKTKSFSLYQKPNIRENTQSPPSSTFEESIKPVLKPMLTKTKEEKQLDIQSIVKNYYSPLWESFEILNSIGSGSESWVNKIIHKKTKKELSMIRFLNYCCSKEDKSEIILMENAKFGNLRNFQIKSLKRSVLSETIINFMANEILKGLVFCHRNKVAHMDLKPQNIVVDDYLHAKLIDFSISINYSDKNPNDKIRLPFKGTKFYMPLEIINSKTIEYKDINKVDSYALGVILYNLAFGCYPYGIKHEDNYDIINEKIKNNKLEFKNENNTFSKYFIDFVEKLLKKDINERMSIYEAMNHYWLKGGNILYDEKEKIYNIYSFTTQLITDNIKEFNDYLRK